MGQVPAKEAQPAAGSSDLAAQAAATALALVEQGQELLRTMKVCEASMNDHSSASQAGWNMFVLPAAVFHNVTVDRVVASMPSPSPSQTSQHPVKTCNPIALWCFTGHGA
jgi:hypothetical protein